MPGGARAARRASLTTTLPWSYLGLLADYQGTALLLQAMARLVQRGAKVHLLLGGYPNIEHYRQLACSLGVAERVTFAGRVPYDQAPAFLALGDIAVAPKLSSTEGAGKILNYMAVGLPTVVYDTSASREYLGDLGVYAELGSAPDLAARLGELVDDPARRNALGQQLRRRAVDEYAWERTGRTILQTYAALLSERHQKSPSA